MLKIHSLVIHRNPWTPDDSPGVMSDWYLDGEWVSYGLENAAARVPVGSYIATRSHSPRYRRYLFELADVPKRKEILLHPANEPHELTGCLAPGLEAGDRKPLWVLQSGNALRLIHSRVKSRPIIVTVIE